MPSYQDLEIRTKVLEDIVGWLIHSMQLEQVVPTGTFGPDGRPVGRVVKKRYIDLYREYKDASATAIGEATKRARRDAETDRLVELPLDGAGARTDPKSDDTPSQYSANSKSFADLRAELGFGHHIDD